MTLQQVELEFCGTQRIRLSITSNRAQISLPGSDEDKSQEAFPLLGDNRCLARTVRTLEGRSRLID